MSVGERASPPRRANLISRAKKYDSFTRRAAAIFLPPDGPPGRGLGQRSQRRLVKSSKRTFERPFVFSGGSVPLIPDGVAVGKRSKRQTAKTCAGRRNRERRFMSFPTRSAVVTREVAKMLPVPTSSKELRIASSVSSLSLRFLAIPPGESVVTERCYSPCWST